MKNLIIVFLLVLMPNISFAGEQELYDAVPPADAAFVRFINAQTDSTELSARVSSVRFDNLSYGDISAYGVAQQGQHNIEFGTVTQSFDIKSGHYYTIALTDDKSLNIINDDSIENPAKAMIYFYNLSDAPKAALFSATHKADIFKNITAGKSKARKINALTLGLTVKAGDKDIQAFENVVLKRRVGTSFVLLGANNQYKAVMIEGSIIAF